MIPFLVLASTLVAQRPSPLPGYDLIINQFRNPGFEDSTLSPWVAGGYYTNPYIDDYGNVPMQIVGLDGRHRNGAQSFYFGVDSSFGPDLVDTSVFQFLGTATAVNDIASAYVYAWSTADSAVPTTVEVDVLYTDRTVSHSYTDVSGSYYDEGTPGGGWRKVDFLSSLIKGKTITRVTFRYVSYSYKHDQLWIDDAFLGKRVHIQ